MDDILAYVYLAGLLRRGAFLATDNLLATPLPKKKKTLSRPLIPLKTKPLDFIVKSYLVVAFYVWGCDKWQQ